MAWYKIDNFAALSLALILTACGGDAGSNSTNSEEKTESTVIENKTISGFSQKGPFVNGSSITVQELNGETLSQTGKSFKGKISNDKGEFSVANISLISQYAILEATGYYRNEVSGKKSNGTITLSALTDLSNRKEVNVNLLTHLEYDRVIYLVIHEKKSVENAKKQAESEILSAFNIKGDFTNSEDLNIFSKGKENAALLAFSILMLNDNDDANFTELLANFAKDIEKDGKWDDYKSMAKIADWAANEDLSDGLASIRKNIEEWNLGTVPDFEDYIRIFWQKNYELDDCDKKKEGTILATKNKLSKSYNSHERYICNNGAWKRANDKEKDTYKWDAGKDGDSRWGEVNVENCYVFEDGSWRIGNTFDCSLQLRGCTKARQDSIGLSSDSVWYICHEKSWQKATAVGNGNFLICQNNGKIVVSNKVKYVCDGSDFRELDSLENIADSACTNYNREVFYVLPKTYHYLADEKERWHYNFDFLQEKGDSAVIEPNYSYYKCADSGWIFASEKRNDGVMVDKRDNHVYKTIGINSQVWMAENLKYSLNDSSLSFCYNKESSNCEKYGMLYTESALENICPEGFHLPTRVDWIKLLEFTYAVNGDIPFSSDSRCGGSASYMCNGEMLKSKDYWPKDSNGTDILGFNALPAGFYNEKDLTSIYGGHKKGFGELNHYTEFWAGADPEKYFADPEEYLSDYIFYRVYLTIRNEVGIAEDVEQGSARSVRCVKD